MSRWFRVTLAVLVPLTGLTLTLCAGITNAYGTGTQLQANVGGWLPDGAKGDTFWDASVIDVPGFSAYAVHCHGRMRVELQLGATGPSHSNPCYAAMGMYSGGSEDSGTYMVFPRWEQRHLPRQRELWALDLLHRERDLFHVAAPIAGLGAYLARLSVNTIIKAVMASSYSVVVRAPHLSRSAQICQVK